MGWIKNWFRKRYENEVSLPYGILKFLGNFVMLQMGPEEYLDITAPSRRIVTNIRITPNGARPMLSYRYWPVGWEWREDLPAVQVIIEEKRILFKCPQDTSIPNDPLWEVGHLEHPVIAPLRDLFLGFAFYQPMRAEHKKKKEVDAEKTEKVLE